MTRTTKAVVWKYTAIPLTCVLVGPFSAAGLESKFPTLGTKLSKVFSPLGQIEGVHLLRYSHAIAVVLIIIACTIWTRFLTAWFAGKAGIPGGVLVDRVNHYINFSLVLAAVLLGIDGLMFYFGLREEVSGWGIPALVEPTAVLGTVMYVCCSVFVSFQAFNIRYSEEP